MRLFSLVNEKTSSTLIENVLILFCSVYALHTPTVFCLLHYSIWSYLRKSIELLFLLFFFFFFCSRSFCFARLFKKTEQTKNNVCMYDKQKNKELLSFIFLNCV